MGKWASFGRMYGKEKSHLIFCFLVCIVSLALITLLLVLMASSYLVMNSWNFNLFRNLNNWKAIELSSLLSILEDVPLTPNVIDKRLWAIISFVGLLTILMYHFLFFKRWFGMQLCLLKVKDLYGLWLIRNSILMLRFKKGDIIVIYFHSGVLWVGERRRA